ncbi:bifunctional 5,10-methylenetetrahydrofolate dehydrogenase/5,10-methenyltetrahydrofolate cyclohydrolase [Candidatus Magnetominusculus xianensis]|nr:bifunctional 5,10-methylenetetrahydrofolate dehydrogenase/5,10-methenyltetrahydrofolate cyclohydrolase [Candidatus Magnetominusculus xianensis]MBF0402395.1 bifunctional 5,10-methylenetetrahydrofolate dehydrogenase/5,10-methenyltetrahydrofolate cyclohydrolase [Nitrospirota bacterium]
MSNLMSGKKLAADIKACVKSRVEKLSLMGIDVGLALMQIGGTASDEQYLNTTVSVSRTVGIKTYEYRLPETASLNEIINTINNINADERINGLLVLFPIPRRINPRRVVNAILPEKDVDGLGSTSVGMFAAEESMFQIFDKDDFGSGSDSGGLAVRNMACVPHGFLPCTPFGVIRLLEHYGVEIKGKNAVVIGKSLAVGKPLALMLLAKEATVTICHKSSADLAAHLRNADIVCAATGVSGLIKGNMIKEGAVIVDIGINIMPDGSFAGDVDFESVAPRASFITPVPGGVGPVTIATLLENTLRSAQNNVLLKTPLILP